MIRGNAAGRGGVIRGGVIRGGVTRGARGMTRGTRGIVRTRGTWTVVNSTRGTAWQGGARGSARGGGGGGIRGGVRGVKRGELVVDARVLLTHCSHRFVNNTYSNETTSILRLQQNRW